MQTPGGAALGDEGRRKSTGRDLETWVSEGSLKITEARRVKQADFWVPSKLLPVSFIRFAYLASSKISDEQ